MTMTTTRRIWLGGLFLLAAGGGMTGYLANRARAAGIPAANALTYGGVLTDATTGAPLTGSKNIQVVIFDAATGGTQQCANTPAPQTLVAGGFQVALPDSCTTVVHGKTDLWVELFVDGATTGRAKVAAAPFAVEADHAVTATTASATPWSGVTGVPISIAANDGTIQIGGSNRTLTAANSGGNLHIDSAAGGKVGAIYLDYYGGTGTNFGNGAGAVVGSIDALGTFVANGMIGGTRGGKGAYIRDRVGDNGVSFEWDGATLHFYVEDVLVKNFIIPHPTDRDRYLVHTTLEGPENAVFYRGTARLHRGSAEVMLPSYFEAATRGAGRTVLLTPKFVAMDEPISALAASPVRGGAFVVRAIEGNNPEQAFDWEVKAVRADAPDLVAEPRRDDVVVRGEGPYKYVSARRAAGDR
jgi:hypothetical protein